MALHKRNRGFRKSTSAAPVHDGTNLLIFTAGLTGPFRFVSTVTIMQHAIRLSALDLRDRYRSQRGNPTAKAEGITAPGACQRVGQTLALFPYLRRSPN